MKFTFHSGILYLGMKNSPWGAERRMELPAGWLRSSLRRLSVLGAPRLLGPRSGPQGVRGDRTGREGVREGTGRRGSGRAPGAAFSGPASASRVLRPDTAHQSTGDAQAPPAPRRPTRPSVVSGGLSLSAERAPAVHRRCPACRRIGLRLWQVCPGVSGGHSARVPPRPASPRAHRRQAGSPGNRHCPRPVWGARALCAGGPGLGDIPSPLRPLHVSSGWAARPLP